jgi:hypothetical protein
MYDPSGSPHGLIRSGAVADLVDRLAEHKTLGAAPREELAWLVSHGSLKHLAEGEVLSRKGVPVAGMFVVLTGHIALFVDRGVGRQARVVACMAWSTAPAADRVRLAHLVRDACRPQVTQVRPREDTPRDGIPAGTEAGCESRCWRSSPCCARR